MPRELNPELFQSLKRELELEKEALEKKAYSQQAPASNPFEPEFEVTEKDWNAVVEQIRKLTKQVKEQEIALQKQDTQVREALGGAKVRIERIGAGAQRLDEKSQMKFSEVAQKLASLTSKVTERKISDQKIEELLARHNQAVQNFELRLQQMQKVITEQEMQLMNYRSALIESQRELERLKR